MGRRASLQMTANKGELDPDLSERVDLEAYYDSLAKAPNTVFHPQGGYSDRGGFMLNSDADILATGNTRRLRKRIVPIAVTDADVTSYNGGNKAYLVDAKPDTTFVTNAVTGPLFVAFEVDLRVPTAVEFVDLVAFKSELVGADEAVLVQYFDGSDWITFADAPDVPAAKGIRTAVRTRRFGMMPGRAGGAVQARQWRVVVVDAVGIGQVTIGGLRMWREIARNSPVHVEELARDLTDMEELVIGERNVDVYVRQRYVASVPIDVAAQQVAELSYAGGFDTLMLFHEMIETPRIMRQGSAGEWNIDAAPFENVPNLISQAVFSGDQDEIQDVALAGLVAGDVVYLFHGGSFVAALAFVSYEALRIAFQASLAALCEVSAADIVTEVVDGSTIRVRFSGAAGNRAWPLVSAIVEREAVEPLTTVKQAGVLTTGKYWEARTGWPQCGTFVLQRLMLAGFRAAPTSYRFSMVPAYFDFTSTGDPLTADKGFGGALDVKEIERIVALFVGRHLQIYTLSAEWYSPDRGLDATKPVGFVRTTTNGIERGPGVAFVDGATLFVQKGGRTLRDFLYSDIEQAYNAEALSVLAPHIITGCVDIDVRLARDVREGNLVMMVNADGSLAAVTLLRKQNVVAGAPWTTDGKFISILVTSAFDVLAVIERGSHLYLEKRVPGVPLDFATKVSGPARSMQDGAGHLEGRDDVWGIADGDKFGPVAVVNGKFPVPENSIEVIYGLLPEWRIAGNVLREKLAAGQPFRPPGRIFECELALRDTAGVTITTHDDVAGSQTCRVSLARTEGRRIDGGPLQTATGGDPFLPMMQSLYTGNVTVQGLLGVSKFQYLEFGRDGPEPVHVKSARYEVSYKGD